jgi:hypothetical protein
VGGQGHGPAMISKPKVGEIVDHHPPPEKTHMVDLTIHGRDAMIIRAVLSEIERSGKLHGNMPDDLIHAAAIISEESGELIQAALKHNYEFQGVPQKQLIENMLTEAIQTGAMAIKFIEKLFDLGLVTDPNEKETKS